MKEQSLIGFFVWFCLSNGIGGDSWTFLMRSHSVISRRNVTFNSSSSTTTTNYWNTTISSVIDDKLNSTSNTTEFTSISPETSESTNLSSSAPERNLVNSGEVSSASSDASSTPSDLSNVPGVASRNKSEPNAIVTTRQSYLKLPTTESLATNATGDGRGANVTVPEDRSNFTRGPNLE